MLKEIYMKNLTIIPPIGELLGREHIKIEKGHVTHKYKLDNRFANRNNMITGGVLSTALDMLCGHALHTLHDSKHATIELKTIFLAPAFPGIFLGEGNVIKIGKSIGFAESKICDENKEEIAAASATFRIFSQ
tara:strand:- start:2497 stop:2895 length:399 start_codon:yes stop_codon:yes gene_type:complete